MRTAINILAVLVAAALALGLYKAKTEAKEDRVRIAELQAALDAEREALTILRNEIAYLEDPARLRALAEEKLALEPADPLRVVTMDEAPLLLAPDAEEDAETDVTRASADGDPENRR